VLLLLVDIVVEQEKAGELMRTRSLSSSHLLCFLLCHAPLLPLVEYCVILHHSFAMIPPLFYFYPITPSCIPFHHYYATLRLIYDRLRLIASFSRLHHFCILGRLMRLLLFFLSFYLSGYPSPSCSSVYLRPSRTAPDNT